MWNSKQKLSKKRDLAEEVKAMWEQDKVNIIPGTLPETGVVPRMLAESLKRMSS